jgi:phosphoribosylanthranilate isomerase
VAEIVKVGIFVNADVDAIREAVDRVGLDLVQLHGDEPPEFLRELTAACPLPIMRAFRLGPTGLIAVVGYLDECRRLGCVPHWVLLDAHRPDAYGGTGAIADWAQAAEYAAMPNMPPLVLAGGLTPRNVAQAIAAVHPSAVDTAGGVESSPGRKDPAAVQAFVQAAQAAMRESGM